MLWKLSFLGFWNVCFTCMDDVNSASWAASDRAACLECLASWVKVPPWKKATYQVVLCFLSHYLTQCLSLSCTVHIIQTIQGLRTQSSDLAALTMDIPCVKLKAWTTYICIYPVWHVQYVCCIHTVWHTCAVCIHMYTYCTTYMCSMYTYCTCVQVDYILNRPKKETVKWRCCIR